MEVIVPDEFLSVAIGKRGQNVRLASKLTGWHLDVNSESQYNETMKSGYDSLVQISGVGVAMADAMVEKGLYSAQELATADIDDLIQIRGIGEEKARQIVESARRWVETQATAEKSAPAVEPETEASPQEEETPPETTSMQEQAPQEPAQDDTAKS
jgi:N utilization substance protein A